MNVKKRNEWIDTLKGITIFLVVVGHVLHGFNQTDIWAAKYVNQGVFLEDIIYVFHMPLFILLSGYTFGLAYINGKEISKKKYNRQLVNLLALYFLHSIVYGIIKIISTRYVNSEIYWKDLFWIPLKAIDLYWYLYVLFFLYIIGNIFVCQNYMRQKFILICAITIQIIYVCIGIDTSFTVIRVIYYLPFFLIGIMYQMNQLPVKDTYSVASGILAIVWWICNRYILFDICRFYNEISQLIVTIFIVNMIFVIFNKYRIRCNIFQYLGKHSLEIYLLHIFVTSGSRAIYMRLGCIFYWIAAGFSIIMGIGIPLLFSEILRKCNLWSYFFKPMKKLDFE